MRLDLEADVSSMLSSIKVQHASYLRHEGHNYYSKTCLKRTCSKADTWLMRTKIFVQKYQFTGQSLIHLIFLKRTPV